MADIASRPAIAPRLPWRTVGVALVILSLLIAGALFVGSRQTRLPAPFGPAANGLITYMSEGDIYVGDPVTGETRLIVGGRGFDWGPSYSADGTLIGFIRDVNATEFDIYVVRPDGSELRKLTPEPIPNQSWAQWVPDSRHIATIRPVLATGCAVTICFTNQLDLIDVTDGSTRTVATAEKMDYVRFRPPDANELMYRARIDGKWGLFAMTSMAPPCAPLPSRSSLERWT